MYSPSWSVNCARALSIVRGSIATPPSFSRGLRGKFLVRSIAQSFFEPGCGSCTGNEGDAMVVCGRDRRPCHRTAHLSEMPRTRHGAAAVRLPHPRIQRERVRVFHVRLDLMAAPRRVAKAELLPPLDGPLHRVAFRASYTIALIGDSDSSPYSASSFAATLSTTAFPSPPRCSI